MRSSLPFSLCICATLGLSLGLCPESTTEYDALRLKARELATSRDFSTAVDCFKAAADAHPQAGENWADLTMAYSDAGNDNGAYQALVKAVDPRSNNPAPSAGQMYMIGVAMMRRSMLPEAAVAFEFTTSLKKDHDGAWLNLGAVQQSLGMAEQAVVSYRKAVAIKASHSAYFNLASSLQALGRLEEASEAVTNALDINSDADTLGVHASISLSLGDPKSALDSCDAALGVDPKHVDSLHTRGLCHHMLGSTSKAIEDLSKAHNLRQDDPSILHSLGAAHAAANNTNAAVGAFDGALQRMQADQNTQPLQAANTLTAKGAALHSGGRVQEAAEVFKNALEVEPQHASAKANLQALFHSSGIDSWFFARLADLDRHQAMREAFKTVLQPGSTVAMVQAGASSLAPLEAALSFESSNRPAKVISLQRRLGMVAFMRRAARANGMHDRMHFEDSDEHFIREAGKADTLLWDISDAADLPHTLSEVEAAKSRMPSVKKVLPEGVVLHAELVQWPLSSASIAVALKDVEGFDVSRFNTLLPGDGATELVHLETQPHEKLSDAFETLKISTGNTPREPAKVEVKVTKAGTANAIVFWTSPTDAGLEGLTTGSACASCRQGLQVLKGNLEVKAGDMVTVKANFLEGILTLSANMQGAAKPKMGGKRLAAKGMHIVPSWHFGMLNDHPRNKAYLTGVEDAITKKGKGSRVLDLGCGSSLLSMMSVRAGAASSICCELEPPIAETANKIVQQNGLAAQVKIVNRDCTKLELNDLPESQQADVLVSEMIDSGLLGDEWLTLLDVARKKNLIKEGAMIVPSSAVVFAAGIELPSQPRPVFSHLSAGGEALLDLREFDLAGRNMTAIADVRMHEITHKRITEDLRAFDFDFMKVPLDLNREHVLEMKAKEPGTVHAVAFWFTMELGGGAQINTSPDTEDGPISHWKQAVQLLQDPVVVKRAGEVLRFKVSHDPSRISFEYLPRR